MVTVHQIGARIIENSLVQRPRISGHRAMSQLCNARSRRVEFIGAEFNGTGVSLPYIEHQVSGSDAASR
jgi:hypothetical protein